MKTFKRLYLECVPYQKTCGWRKEYLRRSMYEKLEEHFRRKGNQLSIWQ